VKGLWLLVSAVLLGLSAEHFLHDLSDPPRVGRPNYDFATLPYLRDSRPPQRLSGERALAYASRLNRYVHRSTYHCHYTSPGSRSILERYLLPETLFPQGSLDRSRFECGQCGQRSWLLVEYLDRAGIPSRILGVKGHVVVLVGDYVLDPDFGVGPFLYSDETTARAAYAQAPQDGVDYAALIASRADNFFYDMAEMRRLDRAQARAYRAVDAVAALMALIALLSLWTSLRSKTANRSYWTPFGRPASS
jgi:hypothetical protein